MSKTSKNGVYDTLELVQNLLSQLPDKSNPYNLSRYGGGAIDLHGIIGDILATLLSTPVCTYLAAPVFTLMEEMVAIKTSSEDYTV